MLDSLKPGATIKHYMSEYSQILISVDYTMFERGTHGTLVDVSPFYNYLCK